MSKFDEIVDRRGSGSYKWDSETDRDTIPLWVADMDFRAAPVILDALRRRVEQGVFGYTYVDEGYYESLINWFSYRHGYAIERDKVIYTSGVVPAISAIIKALTNPGDGVVVQTPVYNCFFSSIRNNGCEILENRLIRLDNEDGTFSYRMDFDGLEKLLSETHPPLLLLCNPHNPAGRLWQKEELGHLRDICRAHGVRVVSDEIHCELTMPGKAYVPYGTIDDQAIVCLSPSKAFNTAGLQIANIVCPDKGVRAEVDRAININEVCDVNPFGVVALKAAYSEAGALWLDELRIYLAGNYAMLMSMFREHLPQCPVVRLEATYLPWVDISALGLDSESLEHGLLSEAKVWINAGVMYGKEGYIRINIACPRAVLKEGLDRMITYINRICSR